MTEPQSGISYSALIVEALTRYGDRAAFIQGDRSVSYAEAADITSRIRAVLEGKGSTKGSCIGALSVNSPDVWLVQAAAYLSGAMYTGLHPLGSVALCERRHLFLGDEGLEVPEHELVQGRELRLATNVDSRATGECCKRCHPEGQRRGPAGVVHPGETGGAHPR